MASTIDELKNRFRRGNLCIRLIYITVALFVVCQVAEVCMTLFNQSIQPLFRWLELPASLERLMWQPWSLVTYLFMHGGVIHLLFNMLWLHWFGNLFLKNFSTNHFRGLYLLGGLGAALSYLVAFNCFPYFQPMVPYSYMLGASGAVLAIVAAVAYRLPNMRVQLLLIGTVRLSTLAIITVVMDLLFVTSSNGGGHIAHLGGAATGLIWAWALTKGTDLTRGINALLTAIERLFSPKPRQPKMKVTYGGKHGSDYDYNARKKSEDEAINQILDKLKKSGYESLTTEEKQRLFSASRH